LRKKLDVPSLARMNGMPHIAEARPRVLPLEEPQDEQPVAEALLGRGASVGPPLYAKAAEELQRQAATRASERDQPESAACVPAELLRARERPDAERASLLLCVLPEQLPVSLTAAVLVSAVRVAQ